MTSVRPRASVLLRGSDGSRGPGVGWRRPVEPGEGTVGVFGAATQQLVAWLSEVCPETEIVLGPPRAEPDVLTVYAFLLEVRPRGVHSDRRRALVEAALRFAVAADGGSPEETHEVLGDIYAAAALERELRIVAERVAPEVWAACGVAPLPCFQVEVPTRSERELEHRWIVEHPLEVQVVDREEASASTGGVTDATENAEASDALDERQG